MMCQMACGYLFVARSARETTLTDLSLSFRDRKRRSVREFFCRYGIRFRNEVPDGMRIFICGKVGEGNDFNGFEFEFPVESEKHGIGIRINSGRTTATEKSGAHGTRPMKNVNIVFSKPVFIEV